MALPDGSAEDLYFDGNCSATHGLIHEDYQRDAILIDPGLRDVALRTLSPVDLAVGKITRLADPDQDDPHDLVEAGLSSADEIESRAAHAIEGYVGNVSSLRLKFPDCIEDREACRSGPGERASAAFALPSGEREHRATVGAASWAADAVRWKAWLPLVLSSGVRGVTIFVTWLTPVVRCIRSGGPPGTAAAMARLRRNPLVSWNSFLEHARWHRPCSDHCDQD